MLKRFVVHVIVADVFCGCVWIFEIAGICCGVVVAITVVEVVAVDVDDVEMGIMDDVDDEEDIVDKEVVEDVEVTVEVEEGGRSSSGGGIKS